MTTVKPAAAGLRSNGLIMSAPVTQDPFAARHQRWLDAEGAAASAERALNHALDRYCEGTGPAPSIAEGERTRELRGDATGALAAVLGTLEELRRRIDIL